MTRYGDINSTHHEGCIWDPILGAGEVGGGQWSYQWLERALAVSYMLFIMTIALSVTIRLQFAIEQGVGHFGSKF